jgi:hypothetical protein
MDPEGSGGTTGGGSTDEAGARVVSIDAPAVEVFPITVNASSFLFLTRHLWSSSLKMTSTPLRPADT